MHACTHLCSVQSCMSVSMHVSMCVSIYIYIYSYVCARLRSTNNIPIIIHRNQQMQSHRRRVAFLLLLLCGIVCLSSVSLTLCGSLSLSHSCCVLIVSALTLSCPLTTQNMHPSHGACMFSVLTAGTCMQTCVCVCAQTFGVTKNNYRAQMP